LRVFKQLQEGGRLAPGQPTMLQRGDARALALYVSLGLQNVPFRHLDVISQCHQPLNGHCGQRVPWDRRHLKNAGLDWSLPQLQLSRQCKACPSRSRLLSRPPA